MRRPAIEALKASKRFDPPMAINHVAELAKPFLSIGNQYGEGWFLAGEMAELITSGTPNIVCIPAQTLSLSTMTPARAK